MGNFFVLSGVQVTVWNHKKWKKNFCFEPKTLVIKCSFAAISITLVEDKRAGCRKCWQLYISTLYTLPESSERQLLFLINNTNSILHIHKEVFSYIIWLIFLYIFSNISQAITSFLNLKPLNMVKCARIIFCT